MSGEAGGGGSRAATATAGLIVNMSARAITQPQLSRTAAPFAAPSTGSIKSNLPLGCARHLVSSVAQDFIRRE
jgi:hypothetical protein